MIGHWHLEREQVLNDQQRLQEYYRLLLDIQPKRALTGT